MATNRIARNVAANYLGIFAQIAIAFMLTPFLVNTLGDTKYGIWSIAAAFTGYMCLLDLGISSAVNRYVARYNEIKDVESLNNIVSSALVMFIIICFVICSISPFLASLIVNSMSFDAEMHEIVYLLIIIVSFDVALFVLGNLFRGIFGGLQRYEIINYTKITSTVYKAVLFYLFLSDGYGLVAMGYISVSANILTALGYFFLLKKIYPFVSFRISFASKEGGRKIYKFGGYSFLAMLANQIIYYSDAFVIGYFMTAAAVTYYTIPWSLAEYAKRMCLAVSGTYAPAISAEDSKNDMSLIRQMYTSGTKYMIIISNLINVGVMVLGGALIAIWMGPKYKELCETVLLILFINLFIQGPQLISYSVLQGLAKQKVYSYVSLGVSFANLFLSIILVQSWGIVGVAIGAAVPQILFHGVFVPLYTLKVLEMSPWQYFKNTYLVTLLPTVAFLGSLIFVNEYYYPEGYLSLFLSGGICAVLYLVCVLLFSLNRDEKRTVYRFVGKYLKA